MKKYTLLFLCMLPLAIFCQRITTIAGDGTPGHLNGPALISQFDRPEQTAIDKDGNIYVADYGNNVIRKITPDSIVSTFAGTGIAGDLDGDKHSAQFNQPIGITIDHIGNIYVADGLNQKIKVIRTNGMVETVAGDGSIGYLDGHASSAQFNEPVHIGVDKSLHIYVADRSNHCIRKIDQSQDSVYTFAGTGTAGFVDGASNHAQFSEPVAVEIDLKGNLIVSDQRNHAIRKIDPQGIVTTVAGDGMVGYLDGQGDVARFAFPKGITLDSLGNVYITDLLNFVIRKIDTANVVTTIMGNASLSGYLDGEKDIALLGRPVDVQMVDNQSLLVTDCFNHVIRKIALPAPSSVSIQSIVKQSQFNLYPNPAKDIIRLEGEFGNDFLVTIFDAQGKVIWEGENKRKLDLQAIDKGYYFLKISGADFYGIKTFLKR